MDENKKFKLTDAFIDKFKLVKPPFGFNGLGELVYFRTYSRLKEDGKNEVWFETVRRVVEGCYNMQKKWIENHQLGWDARRAQKSAQEMYTRIFNMKFLPPGRGLWAMGTALTEERELYATLNNCSYVSTNNLKEDLAKPFVFLMDSSMLGIGVGFDTKGAGQIVVKQPKEDIITYQIPDTREGWVESVKLLIESYFLGKESIRFDYTLVRPEGLPIKGFGGLSSGPEPLRESHEGIRKVLQANVGSPITVTTIVDIQNLIGKCVVAGNVRRCLPKGTLIHTAEGLIPIENIKPGMKAKTSKGFSEISELVYQGQQKLISIKTQLGEFKCTDKHKIAKMTSPSTYTWVMAKDLNKEDRVVFVNSITPAQCGASSGFPEFAYEKPKNSTTCKDISIPTLDKDSAWLLGLIFGDGYVYPNVNQNGKNAYVAVACSTDYPAIITRCKEQLSRFGVNFCDVLPTATDNCYKVRVASKQLALFLSSFKTAKSEIVVPEFILKGSVEVRCAFLAGLFDSDGSKTNKPIIALSSIYPDFTKQIQALYASVGIPVRMQLRRKAINNCKALYQLSVVGEQTKINFKESVPSVSSTKDKVIINKTSRSQNDFSYPKAWSSKFCPNKNITTSRYDELHSFRTNLVPVIVHSVDDTNIVSETYDISVPDTKEFVCQEGLLVHNTAEIAFGEYNSEEFLDLKNYTKNPHRDSYGWTSNNSIFAKLGMDYDSVCDRIGINGEPGLAWLDNMRAYSRMGDPEDNKDSRVTGANPCVTGDMFIMTAEGPKLVTDLLGKPFTALVDGKLYKSTDQGFFFTGIKDVYRVTTKRGYSLKCTDNHLIMTDTGWKPLKDLNEGVIIKLHDHTLIDWSGKGTIDEGWLLGSLLGDGHFTKTCARLGYWGVSKEIMLNIAKEKLSKSVICRSDIGSGDTTGKIAVERDALSLGSVGLFSLAEEYNLAEDKVLKSDIEFTSSNFYKGFLQGWFDADGSIQGDQRHGVSVRLSSVIANNLVIAQRMLARLGIMSTIYNNRQAPGKRCLPNGKGGSQLYECKASHDLVISNINVKTYADLIGFATPEKQQRLQQTLTTYKRKLNREKYSDHITGIEKLESSPVFDCTIPGINMFDCNGIVVHNCNEQSLESYELCCLVETFPGRHDSKEDYLKTLKYAYLYGKTVTLGKTHWPETNRVMLRNRRIGCSVSGIAQFITQRGLHELKDWLQTGYAEIQKWDTLYSEWFAIPKSVKTTSIKPSGSVSLLAGATPGMHYPESRFYIRRIRLSKNSSLIVPLKKAGYKLEPAFGWEDSTLVVEIPVDVCEGIRTSKDVSMWEQLSLAAFLQKYWADNQVSCTVTFDPVTEKDQISNALDYFQYQLKGVSFLPRLKEGAYKQMPYEEISEERYNEILKTIKPLSFSSIEKEKAEVELFCNNDVCVIKKKD